MSTMDEKLEEAKRFEAATRVLSVLLSPMAMMTKPDREEALRFAKEYRISAAELLEIYSKVLKRT